MNNVILEIHLSQVAAKKDPVDCRCRGTRIAVDINSIMQHVKGIRRKHVKTIRCTSKIINAVNSVVCNQGWARGGT